MENNPNDQIPPVIDGALNGETSTTQLKDAKILIVEDTPIQAKKLKFYLERMGYPVDWAINGKDALDVMDKNSYDLVITDVQMPEMDGLEMLSRIRDNSKLKQIPVIVITTLDTDDACERSIALGADDFIAKPFKPREIGLRIDNIIERKRNEEFAKIQLQAIENAMDGMAILNKDQEFVYANEAQVKVFGYIGRDDILGNNWDILYSPDEIKRLKEEILPVFRKEGKWKGEMIGKRRDGSSYPQEVSFTMIEDGKFLCICRDISERLKRQKEQEEMRKKVYIASRLASVGGLAAGVAHEINNPLTILVGYVKRLEKLINDPVYDQVKCLAISEKLGSTVSRISRILNGMKVYSNMDDEGVYTSVDLQKEILNSIELVKESYGELKVSIETNFQAKVTTVKGDITKIGQIFANLLANARDSYEKKGEGVIKIETTNDPSLKFLIIKLIDNGCGIPKHLQDKVFDAFYTTKPIGQGTGLGLTISFALVEEMGGVLEISSEEGKGTTVIIKVPCES